MRAQFLKFLSGWVEGVFGGIPSQFHNFSRSPPLTAIPVGGENHACAQGGGGVPKISEKLISFT